ncbi:phosphotransferase [Demequina capsici]|uniref:Phosphotransferase n=1 Tax=Demequina capsici TaxID=3075620 RepID=A0AA96F8J2_9MICO|nr:phosphotransferase [Demequina sp. OYTSA14]WNM24625.1 phosphotransferase [Demequina sp. OYTSA14]
MTGSPDRIIITDELVSALVRDQFPHLADREIGRHYVMPDYTAVRVGDDHGVHMPTVPGLDVYYERSTRLIAPFLERWSFPFVPPLRTGRPGHGYPYHFELTSWISASTAAIVPLTPSAAGALGDALHQIHLPTESPLRNPTSSVPLSTFASSMRRWLPLVDAMESPDRARVRTDLMRRTWESGLDTPVDVPFTWTHGRLAPRFVISDQGAFAGLVEWCYFAPGDPAADLAGALMLLPANAHEDLLGSYGGATTATRTRIAAIEMFLAAYYLTGEDPFTRNLAWRRLRELEMLDGT